MALLGWVIAQLHGMLCNGKIIINDFNCLHHCRIAPPKGGYFGLQLAAENPLGRNQ